MEEIRIIDLKESILADNDADADRLREELAAEKTVYINVMSSPGSGKTSTILRLVEQLRLSFSVGVLEADIDGDVDTKTMLDAGIPSVQLHTGDIVILENVGNLVCPAEFDTGAQINLVILSVPEGDDKPLKYPLMFTKADVVVVNKIDAMEVFDFSPGRFMQHVVECAPGAPVFMVSAATGEGIIALSEWIGERAREILEYVG